MRCAVVCSWWRRDVQRAAADAGLMYPVDFAAKGTAHIGGSIATNAGGVRVLRYGSTRAWVRELKVVLASGEVIKTGGALVKDNTGYELRQRFTKAIGHPHHTADVSNHGACSKRVVGNNLCDLFCSVPLTHIFDHPVASDHAEVDIEVR